MLTLDQALKAVGEGASGFSNKPGEEVQAKLKKYLAAKEPEQAGQKQAAVNAANLETLKNPELQNFMNQGGSVGVGDLKMGPDVMLKMQQQGPHQATAFNKVAHDTYKGINDQLDAGQSTIEALNQKNAQSDKLALISEARLAAGQGGSRAIKSIMDSLSGGKTSGMDYQTAMNYIQNTPNVPVMQDSARDALRESVFNRLNQVKQQHQQAASQLMQQGPVLAPQADYNTLINSYVKPADEKVKKLEGMYQDYTKQRAAMQDKPVSSPSQADPNMSTLDRLKSLFGGSKPAQQAPAAGGFNPDSYLKGQ